MALPPTVYSMKIYKNSLRKPPSRIVSKQFLMHIILLSNAVICMRCLMKYVEYNMERREASIVDYGPRVKDIQMMINNDKFTWTRHGMRKTDHKQSNRGN